MSCDEVTLTPPQVAFIRDAVADIKAEMEAIEDEGFVAMFLPELVERCSAILEILGRHEDEED